MTLRDALASRAAATPTAPALETAAETWTFADLLDRARCGAGHIEACRPGRGAPVGLLLDDVLQFAAGFHAVAFAGRPVLPLNLRLTDVEMAEQLAAARVGLLLGAEGDARLEAAARRVPGLRVAPLRPGAPPSAHVDRRTDASDAAADETLAVLYTSGTSGRPKGARLSWANFHASAIAAERRLGPAVRSRWLACLPLFHVGGLSVLVRSVVFGGPVFLLPRFDVAAVSDALDRGDVAGVSLVPTMLSRLLAHRGARPAPHGLDVLLLGGAAAPPALLERALSAGYPVCPTYGLTEATSQVATSPPPPRGARAALPMQPMPGTELRIVSPQGGEVPAGVSGEITVRGPTVMQGYLDDPAATARVLRDGWLCTGDIGRIDGRGGLEVLDRRDDLVVSGGENVYPAEVEAVLLAHPSVAEAGVSGLPDPDLGARVVAWIVLEPGAAADPGELERHCRSRLAGFKRPREIRYVPALPRNAAGKLQRRRLAGIGTGG